MSTKAERFGKAVRRRREELDLSQLDVYFAGGPSNSTLTAIENGRSESLPRHTARKLDTALQWEAGSAKRVWEGGDPTPVLRSDVTPKESRVLRQEIEAADIDDATREALLRVLDERGAG